MTNLIIASENKDSMDNWVDVLEPIYPIVLSKNIDTVILENPQCDENVMLILDASLIDEIHPVSQLCKLIKKIIVVGENYTPRQQIQLIFDGACGYSDKSIDQQLIIRAIEGILNNEIWLERQFIPQVLKGIVAKQYLSKPKDTLDEETFQSLSILTPREIEVIEHIYNGETNLTISNTLHISIRTVKAHLTAIFRKLQVEDRFQLVVYLKNIHVGHLSNEISPSATYHID